MADLNSSIPPRTVFDLSTIYHGESSQQYPEVITFEGGPAPPTSPECTTQFFYYTPTPIFDTQFGENVNNVQPTGRLKVATPKRRAKKPTPAPKKPTPAPKKPTPTPKKKVSVEPKEKTQTKPKKKGSSSGVLKRKRATKSEFLEDTLDDTPMLYDSEDDVIILDEDVGENAGVNDGVGVDVGGGGENNQTGMNNWAKIDPDNLNAEEGYYSSHTLLDGDEGPTQEDIDKVDVELINFAQETENIFANKENNVNIGNPHQLVEDLVPEMEWPTVHAARAYIKRWSIVNKVEYHQYRLRFICVEPKTCNCPFYARITLDGHTCKLRKNSVLKHICKGKGKTSNKLAHAGWVANEAEHTMRTIRPIFGLDGCFLKGKYGGVCLSIIGLDANNGLFPIAVYLCRSECYETWSNFMQKVEPYLNQHKNKLTFIRDRQKGFIGLVPKAEEHIAKIETFYGQYHPEGVGDGCYAAIGANGKRWRVNIKKHECDCHQWQVTGLPCITVFITEFHHMLKHTKKAIYPIVDPSDWGKGIWQTKESDPALPKPKITRQRQRVDTHSSRAEHRRNTNQPPATLNVGGRGRTRGRGRSSNIRDGRSGGIFTHMNSFGGAIGIGIDLFGDGSTRGGTRGGRGRATRGVARTRGGTNRGPNIGGNVGPSANKGGTTGEDKEDDESEEEKEDDESDEDEKEDDNSDDGESEEETKTEDDDSDDNGDDGGVAGGDGGGVVGGGSS
ncbi:hypothetical protein GIB67_041662 [Kingdonia uniflora]|uniref:MULE transposase domain-containing protein n=1 Tax=Kingdonia uniflora TaxID=39325 RepID=A0A7J7MQN9_9MAGN|nr:hypothetical protein GIB67_041662 [Kingdonia uniflora]